MSRTRPLPTRPRQECRECGAFRKPLQAYEAQPFDGGRPMILRLCERCLRDRGAAWRWRWRIIGRELRDYREAA